MTATKKPTRVDEVDGGEWLHDLLAAVNQEIANQPKPRTIAKIRRRLIAELDDQAQAAA